MGKPQYSKPCILRWDAGEPNKVVIGHLLFYFPKEIPRRLPFRREFVCCEIVVCKKGKKLFR